MPEQEQDLFMNTPAHVIGVSFLLEGMLKSGVSEETQTDLGRKLLESTILEKIEGDKIHLAVSMCQLRAVEFYDGIQILRGTK